MYITVLEHPDGVRELKRVRFSRRKFSDSAAQGWWEQHRGAVIAQHGLTIRSRPGATAGGAAGGVGPGSSAGGGAGSGPLQGLPEAG